MKGKIRKLLVKTTRVNKKQVTDDAHLIQDLNLNSIEFVTFIYTLETQFKIEFDNKDLKKLTSINDLANYIEMYKKVEKKQKKKK